MDQTQLLKDKVAVITGAGRGIGRAIALAYAAAGAAVCCAARTAPEIESVVAEIEQAGGRGLAVAADVTAWTEVARLFDATVEAFCALDLLVINAGGNYDRRTVAESRPEDWRATLELNLVGAYYCAKAGLWMLTRVLAQELWPDNIRVNELIPGPVATALTADLVNKPKGTVFSVDSEWIKQPEDVVSLALFLATQPSQGPTAQSYSLMRRDN